MIEVKDLTKSFGSNRAVDRLSFTANKGEVLGLLGPNGAGKTTTMRLITGFLTPDEGDVTVGGISMVEDRFSGQKELGYMPESNPLYKEMLVSELLQFSADLKKIPKNERKDAYAFAVSAVSIEDVYYRPISELSKGYKQRVGMALALLNKPSYLILDEPTEGLDPNQRTDLRKLIKDLAVDRTIIMSTHVMQEAKAVCDRLVIIDDGALVAEGTVDELVEKAQGGNTLEVEIEGSGVENRVKNLQGVKSAQFRKLKNGRVQVSAVTERPGVLQPSLSKVAHANDWVIWKLQEKESDLEDVFHTLTQKS